MSTGERIAELRRNARLTQEDLADKIGVTRQAVSKWESDISYPETDKLIALADLFKVSADYLLRGGQPSETVTTQKSKIENREPFSGFLNYHYEYKSKKTLFGLPLVHVNIGFKPCRAKGIIAVGNIATGLLSVGLVSIGLLSVGLFALGLFVAALLSVGLFSVGCIAVGIVAIGAIAVGVFSIGAISVGLFSFGALAMGKFVAVGHTSFGDIALGIERITYSIAGYLQGSGLEGVPGFTGNAKQYIFDAIDQNSPNFFFVFKAWIKAIAGTFLS